MKLLTLLLRNLFHRHPSIAALLTVAILWLVMLGCFKLIISIPPIN